MADHQVSGSDTESIDGESEGEMLVVDAPDSSMSGLFVLGLDEGYTQGWPV